MGSFVQRRLDVTFQLAAGSFDGTHDTIKLSGLRVQCEIEQKGLPEFNTCVLRVFGLSNDHMKRLTMMQWDMLSGELPNQVIVSAGSNDDDMTVIFTGEIYQGYPDYLDSPDVPFIVYAQAGRHLALKPVNAESYPGAVPIETMAKNIAKQLGATLENNGVTGTLTDHVFAGTATEKLRDLVEAAKLEAYYEPPILAICPSGTPRIRDNEPVINANTGLVGWPQRVKQGVTLTTLFNPALLHGAPFKLESDFPNATGKYYIYMMQHHLESEVPGGSWFSSVYGTNYQLALG